MCGLGLGLGWLRPKLGRAGLEFTGLSDIGLRLDCAGYGLVWVNLGIGLGLGWAGWLKRASNVQHTSNTRPTHVQHTSNMKGL